MNKDFNVDFTEMRSSTKDGIRYAVVRAVANGVDSFNSIFTTKARESLISQLRSNGVKARGLHTNAIDNNIKSFLEAKRKEADAAEKEEIDSLIHNLPNKDFPIGNVIDAKFADDNTVEATIQENYELSKMGEEYKTYLDSAWNMIEGNKLSGVSLVFNKVDSFMNGEKLFIDDMNVLGLDFVDRPSSPNTRVLETFMRAAQQTVSSEEIKMTNEEPKTTEAPKAPEPAFVDVDKVAEKVVEKVNAQAEAKEEEAKKQADIEARIKEAEDAKLKAEEVAKEAIAIGEQLVKEKAEIVANVDNPHKEQIKQAVEEGKNPLEGKSLSELMQLKDSLQ